MNVIYYDIADKLKTLGVFIPSADEIEGLDEEVDDFIYTTIRTGMNFRAMVHGKQPVQLTPIHLETNLFALSNKTTPQYNTHLIESSDKSEKDVNEESLSIFRDFINSLEKNEASDK